MRFGYSLPVLIRVVVTLVGTLSAAGSAPARDTETPTQVLETFERFRFSFFEDPTAARDGLDTTSLAQLVGAERSRAEDMLLAYLPDHRGVISLGVLHSRRAEAVLRRMFEEELKEQAAAKTRAPGSWSALGLMGLAKALWLIRPDPRWVTTMVDMLVSSDEPFDRREAAQALYVVRDPAAVAALTDALDDPETLVRSHAASSLLAIYGLPTPLADPQHMAYRVMAGDVARRERAKQDILAAIAGRSMLAP